MHPPTGLGKSNYHTSTQRGGGGGGEGGKGGGIENVGIYRMVSLRNTVNKIYTSFLSARLHALRKENCVITEI